jgi:uncharacterized protein (TIGR03435 family)
MRRVLSVALAFAALQVSLLAQSRTPPKPTFTVASIRPTTSTRQAGPYFMPGGRLRAGAVTLKLLMRMAYSYGRNGPYMNHEIQGGPDWIETERFDLEATVADSGSSDPVALLRLQALLEDRFSLRVHRESRELPVYDLVLAWPDGLPGPQLRRSSLSCPPVGSPAPPASAEQQACGARTAAGRLNAGAVELSYVALILSGQDVIERKVFDRTGVAGAFDVDLRWSIEPGDGEASIFTALQEQLGLRLQSARGPVDVLVVDHAERPTEN